MRLCIDDGSLVDQSDSTADNLHCINGCLVEVADVTFHRLREISNEHLRELTSRCIHTRPRMHRWIQIYQFASRALRVGDIGGCIEEGMTPLNTNR